MRAILLRRTAQVLVEYVQDEDGAADAYRRLLEIEEDADALRFLQSLALRRDDPHTLADVLKRLAALESNPAERRDLLFEHARVLNQRLERAADAVPVLQQVLQHDPDYEPAYDELVRASETARDYATLADTLERMLARTADARGARAARKRLADVCERELHDATRAIVALGLWAEAEPGDPQPHRRLRPLLLAAQRERELLATLDALSRLEDDREAQIEATLAAAELSRAKLGDSEGAFRRLVPLLAEAHPKADRALLSLAVLAAASTSSINCSNASAATTRWCSGCASASPPSPTWHCARRCCGAWRESWPVRSTTTPARKWRGPSCCSWKKTSRRSASSARKPCSATTPSCSASACAASPRSSRTAAKSATCSTSTATCCARAWAGRRKRCSCCAR